MNPIQWLRNALQKNVTNVINNWVFRENPIIWWDGANEIFWKEGYEKNGTVYSIVNKIAEKVSTIPGYEYKVKNQKSLNQYLQLKQKYSPENDALANLIVKEQMEPFNGSDNVSKILKQPNDATGWSSFVQFVLINKMVYGGCPVWSNTGAVDDGKTLAVYAYNPEMVQIKADPTLTTIIQAQINFFGNTQPVAPDNIYFVKYINSKIDLNGQHLFGFSPLRPALRALQVDNANLEAQLFIMQNKGVLGTFLPENMEALEWIQQGAGNEDELRNKLSKMLTYTGRDASIQRPYINALMKYISFGMDADQMGLDASHKATKRMICQVYDFPPELLADEGTTFNNKEMAVKYLLTNTTAPHRRSIEDFVNNYLYPRNGITDRVFVMDISEEPEVQDDFGAMAEKMRAAGAFTLNEIREVLKWPKLEGIEGMDVPYISAGLRAVNDDGDLDMGDYG